VVPKNQPKAKRLHFMALRRGPNGKRGKGKVATHFSTTTRRSHCLQFFETKRKVRAKKKNSGRGKSRRTGKEGNHYGMWLTETVFLRKKGNRGEQGNLGGTHWDVAVKKLWRTRLHKGGTGWVVENLGDFTKPSVHVIREASLEKAFASVPCY